MSKSKTLGMFNRQSDLLNYYKQHFWIIKLHEIFPKVDMRAVGGPESIPSNSMTGMSFSPGKAKKQFAQGKKDGLKATNPPKLAIYL